MNNKLNIPEEVIPGKNYSFWADMKVNGWLCVAALIGGADILFVHQVKHLDVALRTIIALAPFVVIPLWVRDLARWIRGMDELHQRITLAAILFAVSTTFFFVMLWHRLDKAGFFQAIFPASKNPDASWDICTAGHVILLLAFSYFLGYTIFNRRYK
jgi:hypothetical protein